MFEAQIMIFFVVLFKGHFKLTLGGAFRERIVSLVPPIVDLGFLYSKLSNLLPAILFKETQNLVL